MLLATKTSRTNSSIISFKIRKATEKDRPGIFSIFRDVVRENERRRILLRKGGLDVFAQEMLDFAFDRSDAIYVAISKSEIVGYLFLYTDATVRSIKRGWVFNLGVKVGYRRNGIARSLMKQAERFSKKQGALTVELLVKKENKIAMQFYRKLGYDITFHKMSRDI